jgi:hypothetical protein
VNIPAQNAILPHEVNVNLPGIREQEIFTQLLNHNQYRSVALLEYKASRIYRVSDPNGNTRAEIDGRVEFRAPDTKSFVTTSEQGSAVVRRLALNPLISSEMRAAAGKDRHDSAITPANYELELIGEEAVNGRNCFALRAVPKRITKYLFEGKVWVDKQDFAIVKIEGHPASNLSFWIKRADFVREYQKIDGFWLPQRDQTVVQVRIYGKKLFTIQHYDYIVNGNSMAEAK